MNSTQYCHSFMMADTFLNNTKNWTKLKKLENEYQIKDKIIKRQYNECKTCDSATFKVITSTVN